MTLKTLSIWLTLIVAAVAPPATVDDIATSLRELHGFGEIRSKQAAEKVASEFDVFHKQPAEQRPLIFSWNDGIEGVAQGIHVRAFWPVQQMIEYTATQAALRREAGQPVVVILRSIGREPPDELMRHEDDAGPLWPDHGRKRWVPHVQAYIRGLIEQGIVVDAIHAASESARRPTAAEAVSFMRSPAWRERTIHGLPFTGAELAPDLTEADAPGVLRFLTRLVYVDLFNEMLHEATAAGIATSEYNFHHNSIAMYERAEYALGQQLLMKRFAEHGLEWNGMPGIGSHGARSAYGGSAWTGEYRNPQPGDTPDQTILRFFDETAGLYEGGHANIVVWVSSPKWTDGTRRFTREQFESMVHGFLDRGATVAFWNYTGAPGSDLRRAGDTEIAAVLAAWEAGESMNNESENQ